MHSLDDRAVRAQQTTDELKHMVAERDRLVQAQRDGNATRDEIIDLGEFYSSGALHQSAVSCLLRCIGSSEVTSAFLDVTDLSGPRMV